MKRICLMLNALFDIKNDASEKLNIDTDDKKPRIVFCYLKNK